MLFTDIYSISNYSRNWCTNLSLVDLIDLDLHRVRAILILLIWFLLIRILLLLIRSLCVIRISKITPTKRDKISLFLDFLILYQQHPIFHYFRLTMTDIKFSRCSNSSSLSSTLNTQLRRLLSICIIHKKLIAGSIQATSPNLTWSRTLRLSKLTLSIRRSQNINSMIKTCHSLAIVINLRRANFTLPRCWKLSPVTRYLELFLNILTKLLNLILHLLLISGWKL